MASHLHLSKPGRLFSVLLLFLPAIFLFTCLAARGADGFPFITAYSLVRTRLGDRGWSLLQGNSDMLYMGAGNSDHTIEQYDGVRWSFIPDKYLAEDHQNGATRCMAKDSSGTIPEGLKIKTCLAV